jgi:adenine-specific DNA-methyltransferase
LELNAEDGGQRRFILCSSTEATAKEPEKNLCRDVCAERLRRVMQGYGNKPALGGQFAYLQLDKFEVADVEFDATPAHAAQLLSLRYQQAAIRPSQAKVQLIASDGQVAVVLCSSVDEDSIAQLLAWPCERLVVYSARPATVQNCLAQAGKSVISYSLHDALLRGQSTLRAASR